MARADRVIFLDSDDALHPLCLENRRRYCESHPDLDFLVFGGLAFLSRPGDMQVVYNVPALQPDLDRFLASDDPWQTSHVVWRKGTLRTLGDWDETLPSWQDWEYNVRTLLSGAKYHHWYIADCYWRLPSRERGSIGSHTRSLEHLNAHRSLLATVVQRLHSLNCLTPERRLFLAQRNFRIVQRYVHLGEYAKARETWKMGQENGLVKAAMVREFDLLSLILQRSASPAASNRWLRRWAKVRRVFSPNRIATISARDAQSLGVTVLSDPLPNP